MWKSDVRCVEQFVTVAAVRVFTHIFMFYTQPYRCDSFHT